MRTIFTNVLFIGIIPAALIFILRYLGIALQQKTLDVSNRFFGILLLAPGTIVHELSHYIMAKIFFLPVEKVTLFKYEPATGSLGQVVTGYNPLSIKDKIGQMFVGFAPLIGISTLLSFLYYSLFTVKAEKLFGMIINMNTDFSNATKALLYFISFSDYNVAGLIFFTIVSVLLLSGFSISNEDVDSIKIGIFSLLIIILVLSFAESIVPSIASIIVNIVFVFVFLSVIMIILSLIALLILKLFFIIRF